MKPHQSRYWLNHNCKDTKAFEQQVREICQWHLLAPELSKQGIHLVSTDEMTGIQAQENGSIQLIL